ncbi:Uma2 family endonuclease [Membranihabitans maritimus]|uniref:Uma2 family endonuclease n=1 Tax=Membranihabitans maritimus TaxID=2904244 RepID=UPI001F2BC6AD|nr:Uma2 family endonuclease [Membranihabitans maritimus]
MGTVKKYKKQPKKISRIQDLDLSAIYSYRDYLRWEIEERLELIKGKVFQMAGPNTSHQRVSINISGELFQFLKRRKCEVFAAPFDVRLPVNSKKDKDIFTVVQPDICVVCDPEKIDFKGVIGAPDIVIEILSPSNNQKELKDKYEVYEEAGVREYWIVHPEERTIFRYILDDTGKFQPTPLLTVGDTVSSEVLPGIDLDLTEVFDFPEYH